MFSKLGLLLLRVLGYLPLSWLRALGACLGWSALPSILLIASITGLVGGSIWLKSRGHQLQQAFPFGPFLAIAGIIELLWPQLIPTLILPGLI